VTTTWGRRDREYFRELGIKTEPARVPPSLSGFWWAMGGIFSGLVWYGLFRLLVWALRGLGVAITGVE
jgi:hypothetical protein